MLEKNTLGYYFELLKKNGYITNDLKTVNICFFNNRDNIIVNVDELTKHPKKVKTEHSYLIKLPVEKISLKVIFPNQKEEVFVLKFNHYTRMLRNGVLRDRIIIRPEVHELQCYYFKRYPGEFLTDYMPKDVKLKFEITFTCEELPQQYLYSFLYDNDVLDPVRYNILRKTKSTIVSREHYDQLCDYIRNNKDYIVNTYNIPEGLSDEDIGVRYIEFICQVPFFTYKLREANDIDFGLGKSYIIEGMKTLSKIF